MAKISRKSDIYFLLRKLYRLPVRFYTLKVYTTANHENPRKTFEASEANQVTVYPSNIATAIILSPLFVLKNIDLNGVNNK